MTEEKVAAAPASPLTCTDGACANGAATGLRKKRKKRKRKGYAALMSEITAPASKAPRAEEEEEAERRLQLLRHLGGGAFSKLDKI